MSRSILNPTLSGFNVGVRFNLATGGSDNARLQGDHLTGIDRIYGSRFADQLTGDVAANTLSGGRGNDVLIGRGGVDDLVGGKGADRMQGGNGNDTLSGNTGNDKLFAGVGLDHLNGGNGADRLFGGAGADTLNGGGGNDTLTGGGGNDVLNGGAGNDHFVFANGFGHDTVTHFAAADGEKIDLSGLSAIAGFGDLVAHLETDAATGFAEIMAGTNTILLNHITVSQIGVGHAYSGADFLF